MLVYAMKEEMLNTTALPVPLQVTRRTYPLCTGMGRNPVVPEDMVPSCLMAVLQMVPLWGFFPCWQQRRGTQERHNNPHMKYKKRIYLSITSSAW